MPDITFLPVPAFVGSYTWTIVDLAASVTLATDTTPNGYTVSHTTVGSSFVFTIFAPFIDSGHPFGVQIHSTGIPISHLLEIGCRYNVPLYTFEVTGNSVVFNWHNTPFTYNDVAGRTVVAWEWEFGDGTTQMLGAVETVTHEYAEEFWNTTVHPRARAWDQYGFLMDGLLGDFATGWHQGNVPVGEGVADIFGSFVDAFGTTYTAVNDGDNVQVSKFRTPTAARELLALVEDAKNPSLFQHDNGEIVLGITRKSGGDFVRALSTDFGETFS